ncbi:MAG: pyrimidine dimer DNA glycosylase/endonuclease V [archaeon]
MQTFLPYPNIRKSLKVLDNKRLGKQRVEAHQILNILLNRTKTRGWRNHPVVKMWKKNPNALKLYFNESAKEWIKRGFRNNMDLEKIRGKIVLPFWFGNEKFHSSHRSNLLKKNNKHYSQFRWKEKNNIPYFWP